MNDADLKERFHSSLAAATRALDRGDAAVATRGCIDAANFAWACFRLSADVHSADYRMVWEEFVLTLRRLPPSVLRRAVEFLGPTP